MLAIVSFLQIIFQNMTKIERISPWKPEKMTKHVFLLLGARKNFKYRDIGAENRRVLRGLVPRVD